MSLGPHWSKDDPKPKYFTECFHQILFMRFCNTPTGIGVSLLTHEHRQYEVDFQIVTVAAVFKPAGYIVLS